MQNNQQSQNPPSQNSPTGIKVSFLGGASSVTGSHFLVEADDTRIVVDCGIEQGRNFCELHEYEKFAYDPASVDALFITHAHLDHIGRIPKLVHDGFRGPIYSTPPTHDLAELMLRDSVDILAQDAKRCGVAPLFDAADVDQTFSQWKTLNYHTEFPIKNLSVYLRPTGHILGAASVRVKTKDDTAVAFTGDIGHPPSPLIPDWEAVTDADAVIMDAVYGDKVQEHHDDRVAQLRDDLATAIKRQGTILIPAFSIERTQLMLYHLSNFFESGELPKVPVFLDSPLAINVTEVFKKYGPEYFKPEAQDEIKREHDIFNFPFLSMTKSREESEAIMKTPNPKIIIAGAGMSHGGRIGKHEIKYLPDNRTTLFIVGYQAPGSPGRLLQDHVKKIRLNGQDVEVNAHVEMLTGWSGHADRDELVKFAEATLPRAKVIFPSLGEPAAARFLAQRIHDFIGVRAVVPTKGQSWEITKTGASYLPPA